MASNAEVLEKVGEVAVSIARIEQKMIRFDEISLELTKAIKGNGKPGLDDRVRVIENCHAEEERQKAALVQVKGKRQEFSTKVILILITMVISNVGVLLFSIFK